MSFRIRLAATALAAAAVFCPAAAQDLSSSELGARSSGLAGAFTAKADDATAVFLNPAGIAFLGGTRVKANLIFSRPKVTASFSGGAAFSSSPFQLRGSLALSFQPVRRFSLGLGVFIPHSLETEWPFTWTAQYSNIEAGLETLFIRPVLSAEIVKGLAIGLGFDLVFSKVSWRHYQEFRPGNIALPGRIGMDSRFGLNGRGKGFSAGLLWKPHRAVQAGLRYVHRVSVDHRGMASFTFPSESAWIGVPHPTRGYIALRDLAVLFFRNQEFSSRLTLPAQIAAGLAVSPAASLSLHLDVQRDGWSRFGGWDFRAVNGDADLSPSFTPDLQDFYDIVPDYGLQSAGLVLKDAWKVKTGIEFRPARYFAVRGGFAHQQSPAGDSGLNPLDPTPSLNIGTIGFGYEGPVFNAFTSQQAGEMSFDVYFRYARSGSGSGAIPGYDVLYKASRWEFGVGVGFNF